MTEIVPAIDIIDGKCVRLSKGDYATKKVYDSSVLDMALSYADCGVRRIHMVDLDGAKASEPINLRTLETVASRTSVEIEWGGGIASSQNLRSVLDAGADCPIIGSIAVRQPDLMHAWLKEFGSDRIVLGADARGGKIAVKGWLEDSELGIPELISQFLPDGLRQVVCTDISKDGMLQGPSFELYESLSQQFPQIIFTVSGGISSMADIERIAGMGLPRVIVGKAVYEGRITLKDIEKWSQNA